MIQKEIDTLRQAGIRPIVVITGYQADILEHHIAHRGAVFVRNKNYEKSQMFDSVCLGLKYMQKRWTGCFCSPRTFRWCRPGPF